MNIYDLLEFNRIKAILKTFTKTELGSTYALDLEPYTSKEEVEVALRLLSEAESILFRYGMIPLNQSHNLDLILESARHGNVLTTHDFYLVSADIANILKLQDYFKDKLSNAPLLKAKLNAYCDLSTLAHNIEKVVAPNLSVKDSASNELARIRKNIRLSEDRLTKAVNGLLSKYSSYLAESLVTKREGHFVIPLKTVYKNKVDGIIYDISNSGQTIFIEPQEIASLNNTLISYQNDEIIEINRILRALTVEVMHDEDAIIANNILLAEIDLVFAKAAYGIKLKGMIPVFQESKGFSFKDARHPLIDPQLVVSNSFHLNDEQYIIIISGPNAGGKTVALKTIGLFVLMAKCGLMLPVSDTPSLYFYHHVYVSIGDEQSLAQNLSTFSSHVTRVGSIIKSATSDDLVLIDELGSGTSPEEGEALALAITKHLLSNKISTVISSHYSRLKEFAYQNKGIINASMAFDEHNLAPLYVYHENVPGRSYGLVVARRFGISEAIISEAENFLARGVFDFEKTIGELRREINDVVKEKEEIAAKLRQLDLKEKEVLKASEKLKEELKTFNEEKKERLENDVKEAKKALDDLIKEALKSGGKAHEIIELKKDIKLINEDTFTISETQEDKFELNDFVEVISLNIKGYITRIKDDVITLKLPSGKHLKVTREDLKKTLNTTAKTKKPVVTTDLDEKVMHVKAEINVIGMRVNEALDVIGPYLDRALLKRYPNVRIIHGFGSGALRRGIHEYLAKVPYVKNFSLGGQFDGQGGATIVYFK